MTEIWKDIKGFEGVYQISNMGKIKRLKSTRNEHLLKPNKMKSGFLKICLSKNGRRYTRSYYKIYKDSFLSLI